jgi:hypothetical protein
VTRPSDRALRDAPAHAQRLRAYAEKDLDDQPVVDAICMQTTSAAS